MSERKTPMQGVEIYRNPKNGFTVFQLHYTADPAKRNPSYINHIKESMPIRKFKQEYELQWETYEGLSVYGDWDIGFHGTKETLLPHIGLPLLLGIDFGLTPACLVAQMQEETLVCLKEFTAVNMGIERFMEMIIPQLKLTFPSWQDRRKDFIVFIDPSGAFRKDTDENTCAKIIDAKGFTNIIPGAIDFEERRNSVDNFLTRRTKRGPCFRVSTPHCPILTSGFNGGYRYSDKALDSEPEKLRPIKDKHSHIHDALQMITSKLLMPRRLPPVRVPTPFYLWSEPREGYN
jgi:hypothetical protein